jgi:hypothetical protein
MIAVPAKVLVIAITAISHQIEGEREKIEGEREKIEGESEKVREEERHQEEIQKGGGDGW